MSLPIRLRRAAFRDLVEALAWYERQRQGLGDEFLRAVRDTYPAITQRPNSFAVVHRDVRRALVGRFPYGVYFRVLSTKIVVTAIMHGSRHPKHWQSRS